MKRLTVINVNASMTVISGYGSRDLITEIRGGKPPMFSSRPRGYAVQPSTADDVIALAERRGFLVVVKSGDVA